MTRIYISIILAGLLLTALWGCGSSNSSAPMFLGGQHPVGWSAGTYHGVQALDPVKREQCTECHGKDLKGGISKISCYSCHTVYPHPEGWAEGATQHGPAFAANPDQCKKCHGQDLQGGISKVSCFSDSFDGMTCHANGPVGHPVEGWNNPAVHGPSAKARAVGANGFPYCQSCHGTLFNGGPVNVSCYECHGVSAPHPPKPWRGGTYTHTTTDGSNAVVCALCHTAGANLTQSLKLPSYASGTPGCFNSTLCHGAVGHPTGWDAPTQHGTAAKSAPDSSHGFAYCNTCHVNYSTGVGTSCFTCHTTAPHPAAPWHGTTSSGTTHTTTNQGNAPQCARCHLNNARLTAPITVPSNVTPGCFNNTMCHGTAGHPAGWSAAGQHGAAAKAAPDSSHGFAYCNSCHIDFKNGIGTSCFSCHTKAPHPDPSRWQGNPYSHKTTNQGNAPQCARCHLYNARLTTPITVPSNVTPGCFNSTMCHGSN